MLHLREVPNCEKLSNISHKCFFKGLSITYKTLVAKLNLVQRFSRYGNFKFLSRFPKVTQKGVIAITYMKKSKKFKIDVSQKLLDQI